MTNVYKDMKFLFNNKILLSSHTQILIIVMKRNVKLFIFLSVISICRLAVEYLVED